MKYPADLISLVKPFPANLIHSKGGSYSADYVSHAVVEQRMIAALGYPPDFRLREVVKDSSGEMVGVICQMQALIGQRVVSVEEAGDADPGQGPDASPLKNAMSDAYKRCALRLGVGLHLWAGEDFTLYKIMQASEKAQDDPPTSSDTRAEDPDRAITPPPPAPHSTALADGEAAGAVEPTAEGSDSKAGGGGSRRPTSTDAAAQGRTPMQQGELVG